jgi:hypothetical protein
LTNGGNAPDEIRLTLNPVGESWANWVGIFLGLTNTEAYMTDVDSLDFSEPVDISTATSPVGYLNSNEDPTLHTMKVNLRVGQKVWLKVQITVPRDIESSEAVNVRRFNLNGESTDEEGQLKDKNLEDNDVSMILKILYPDLVVTSGVIHPSKMNDGEIVPIKVEIKNAGDIEARDVIVTFYVDGKEVKSQNINILSEGSSRLIPFTWQAIGGEHDLKIKVDPEDAIVEKLEDNNEKSKTVNIESEGFAEIFSSREGCSITLVIIIITILLAIVIILKKRGSFLGWKPGGGGEEL